MTRCWCGNAGEVQPFSTEYVRCRACGTLVSTARLSDDELRVTDDERDFYGREYWLTHQTADLGYPDIRERARRDVLDRCMHWLKTLLKYKLPPGDALELGAAHGGFVALLCAAGFQASGLELSPWVVEFARQTFRVPIRLGPLGAQDLAPASLDVIALMDVLEHLPDPVVTLDRCVDLLKPDGVLLVQTPRYEGQSYAELQAGRARFLAHLLPREHIHLFTEKSIRLLLERVGAAEIVFEPPVFDHDMFLAASRRPLRPVPPAERDEALQRQPPMSTLLLSFLDLFDRATSLQSVCDERLKVIEQLDRACRERLSLIERQRLALKGGGAGLVDRVVERIRRIAGAAK